MQANIPAKPIQTILLVDDHDLVLLSLHNFLEKSGYNMLEARNGEEALLIAECYPGIIDVMVTDLIMPRMNGRELVQRLVRLRPAMQVIMMSGYPDEVMAQQGLTPSIPVLRKPFRPKRLLRVVEQVLEHPKVERCVASLVQSSIFSQSQEPSPADASPADS
jgi:DNA-binding NtrC family response regulator